MKEPEVPSWLKKPAAASETNVLPDDPKVTAPHSAPPWPAGRSTDDMLAMAEGFRGRLATMIESEGDAACLTFDMLGAFLKATSDHEYHGRNWWAKNSDELHRRLRPLFPDIWPDPELSGGALVRSMERVFPGCKRLAMGYEDFAELWFRGQRGVE